MIFPPSASTNRDSLKQRLAERIQQGCGTFIFGNTGCQMLKQAAYLESPRPPPGTTHPKRADQRASWRSPILAEDDGCRFDLGTWQVGGSAFAQLGEAVRHPSDGTLLT